MTIRSTNWFKQVFFCLILFFFAFLRIIGRLLTDLIVCLFVLFTHSVYILDILPIQGVYVAVPVEIIHFSVVSTALPCSKLCNAELLLRAGLICAM